MFGYGFINNFFTETKVIAETVNNVSELHQTSSVETGTSVMERLMSFTGIFVLILISYAMSLNRKKIIWRPVICGVLLQIIFGLVVMSDAAGRFFFTFVDGTVKVLLSFSEEGAFFVFGKLAYGASDPRGLGQGVFFFFSVLTTIIFFSCLMTVLYHTGIMEHIVSFISRIMQKTMKTSGSESLSAAANIFVGQTEAPLMVKPFVKDMTRSELHAIMTGGFATVAGGVMAAYVLFLRDSIPNIAGHLVTASIMSAPAALAVSKIICPETEHSKTQGDTEIVVEKPDANIIEAASRGASEGMTLMLNVGAMLVGFVALVAMINWGLETSSDLISQMFGKNPYRVEISGDIIKKCSIEKNDKLKFEINKKEFIYTINEVGKDCILLNERIKKDFADIEYTIVKTDKTVYTEKGIKGSSGLFLLNLSIIFGWIFAPISFIMGVPWSEAVIVGRLLGEKLVLTEFIAYLNLADILKNGYHCLSGEVIHLSKRSAIIASYALCGFANFASIGIQIGGIGGIAPGKRSTLAKIGMRAMFAGVIAACMTGTIAGILM
jgi:CNT family concentrative nucleoside transporter